MPIHLCPQCQMRLETYQRAPELNNNRKDSRSEEIRNRSRSMSVSEARFKIGEGRAIKSAAAFPMRSDHLRNNIEESHKGQYSISDKITQDGQISSVSRVLVGQWKSIL